MKPSTVENVLIGLPVSRRAALTASKISPIPIAPLPAGRICTISVIPHQMNNAPQPMVPKSRFDLRVLSMVYFLLFFFGYQFFCSISQTDNIVRFRRYSLFKTPIRAA